MIFRLFATALILSARPAPLRRSRTASVAAAFVPPGTTTAAPFWTSFAPSTSGGAFFPRSPFPSARDLSADTNRDGADGAEGDGGVDADDGTSSLSAATNIGAAGAGAGAEGEGRGIRLLGRGENAVVREGTVLVAPSHEYNHMLTRSAVFVYSAGLNEYAEYTTRGVVLDHPTAFTMGEMGAVYGVLGNNVLFRGGDGGNDSAMMLHAHGNLKGSKPVGDGTSGIYEGGIDAAMEAADDGRIDPDLVKFFFHRVEFTDTELQMMLASESSENDADDAWMSFEVPPSLVLDGDCDRGDVWRYLRNQAVQQRHQPGTSTSAEGEDGGVHFQ